MKNKEDLKNSILHEIRNGNLLILKAEILTSFFKGENINNIEQAYNKFSLNLENEIILAIEQFNKNK